VAAQAKEAHDTIEVPVVIQDPENIVPFFGIPIPTVRPLRDGAPFDTAIDAIATRQQNGDITYDQAVAEMQALLDSEYADARSFVDALAQEAATNAQESREERAEIIAEQGRVTMPTKERVIGAIGGGLNMAATADVLSNFGIFPKSWTRWGFADQVEDAVPSAVAAISDAFCSNSILEGAPEVQALTSDGQVGLTFVGVRQPSVALQVNTLLDELRATDLATYGIDIPNVVLPGEQTYAYIIRGRLLVERAPEGDEDAEIPVTQYTIRLRGPGGETTLEEDTFEAGRPVSWVESKMLRYEGPEAFNEICIEFERDLDELFGETSINGNEACLPLQLK
jgi:hypothetical protein